MVPLPILVSILFSTIWGIYFLLNGNSNVMKTNDLCTVRAQLMYLDKNRASTPRALNGPGIAVLARPRKFRWRAFLC